MFFNFNNKKMQIFNGFSSKNANLNNPNKKRIRPYSSLSRKNTIKPMENINNFQYFSKNNFNYLKDLNLLIIKSQRHFTNQHYDYPTLRPKKYVNQNMIKKSEEKKEKISEVFSKNEQNRLYSKLLDDSSSKLSLSVKLKKTYFLIFFL